MASELKCPLCGGDIQYNDSYSTYDCKNNPSEHYASEEVWQALIHTKKQLDRAKWWLKEIVEYHRYTPITTAEMALKELDDEQ